MRYPFPEAPLPIVTESVYERLLYVAVSVVVPGVMPLICRYMTDSDTEALLSDRLPLLLYHTAPTACPDELRRHMVLDPPTFMEMDVPRREPP